MTFTYNSKLFKCKNYLSVTTISMFLFYNWNYPNMKPVEVCCYKWFRFISILAHTRLRQVHPAHRVVSGIPLGLGLSHLSWWMIGLPDYTFLFHFLLGYAEALPPTVRCHFFNAFSIHMKVRAITLFYITTFQKLACYSLPPQPTTTRQKKLLDF